MNTKKVLSYVFGGLLLLIGLGLIFNGNNYGIAHGIADILIALIILPSFNYICEVFNKSFTTGKRIALGIGTYFILVLLSANTNYLIFNLSYIILVSLFWLIMFVTNKGEFVPIVKKKQTEVSNNSDIPSSTDYSSSIKNRTNKYLAVIEYENEIKESFFNLNKTTLNAIARMISETREKNESPINQDIPEIYISKLLMSFCKDSQRIEKEYDLNQLYTKEYYMRKIDVNCSPLKTYIQSEIKKWLRMQDNQYYNIYNATAIYNQYIEVLTDSVGGLVDKKMDRVFLKQYYDYLDDDTYIDLEKKPYEYPFDYLIDLLATCTCISKLLFIERKVNKLDADDEFYIIISNMSKEIKDINTVIRKSRPIYDEYYTSKLGFIYDDELYEIAIRMIVSKIDNKEISKVDKEILNLKDDKIDDYGSLDLHIKEWISALADKNKNIDISKYVALKIANTVNPSNFDLYLNTLGMTNKYCKFYYLKLEKNSKALDKERYLKGNFEREKREFRDEYSLFDVNTGEDFEKYLERLFKDLGYKVKRCGKSGDQGADLLLEKEHFIYAIQAKYYNEKLGNTPVQEVVGALNYYDADQGVVVTNSVFTPSAKELAKVNNVILIDNKGLKKLISCACYETDDEEDVLKRFEN